MKKIRFTEEQIIHAMKILNTLIHHFDPVYTIDSKYINRVVQENIPRDKKIAMILLFGQVILMINKYLKVIH